MDQSINRSELDFEAFNISITKNHSEAKALSLGEKAQKNNELQQQARYLNRVLEAYSDCV